MRIRPVSHEDRLTVVEHLDELRWRLIVSVAALCAGFAICFWQNHLLFDLLNDPLPGNRRPVTFGVTEPFFTTVTVCAYGALLIAAPVILYQLYAFVAPAFAPSERRVVLPLVMMVPFLIAGGVAFGYFVVLPAALKFLLHFNNDEFNIQIRARDYYSFTALTLAAMGLIFQLPVVILGLTRLGVTSARQLRRVRRYAVVVIAVVAMALPGTDPITMLLEMAPLLVLYELSIVLAAIFKRPEPAKVTGEPAAEGPGQAAPLG